MLGIGDHARDVRLRPLLRVKACHLHKWRFLMQQVKARLVLCQVFQDGLVAPLVKQGLSRIDEPILPPEIPTPSLGAELLCYGLVVGSPEDRE